MLMSMLLWWIWVGGSWDLWETINRAPGSGLPVFFQPRAFSVVEVGEQKGLA